LSLVSDEKNNKYCQKDILESQIFCIIVGNSFENFCFLGLKEIEWLFFCKNENLC